MLSGHGLVAGYRKGRPVLDGVDLDVPPGGVVGLAGPSGCGKTTLARLLGLLQAPWEGKVSVDGEVVRGARHSVPAQLRTRVGLVFQQPRSAVDPRLSLREVMAEPLRATGRREQEATRVAELTDRVGLTGELLERRPHEVSDGQLQRACLARALALRPRYLICDEATGMLDASTTALLVRVVQDDVAAEGTGVLAISHDEALLHRWADDITHW